MLNKSVFKNIQSAKKNILIVTKYWDKEKTQKIIDTAQKKYPDIFYRIGSKSLL